MRIKSKDIHFGISIFYLAIKNIFDMRLINFLKYSITIKFKEVFPFLKIM